MKKIYSIIVLMLLALGVNASAASATKLYVNPGHGGYTSNDRQTTMPTVNGVKLPVYDVTVNGGSPEYSTYNSSNCFWESSGNTYRAQGVKYFWTKYVNSNIKLSRSENTQATDKELSTISSESSSYGGYFMSLHTNAGNASANYVVVMCRSKSSSNYAAYNATSLTMAQKAANWHDYVKLTNVTYSTPRGMTDRNFYGGSSLGVLNTNSAPGYLAESWFHDYRPEAFRLCSKGYNFFLAWQLMRAYLESPGISGVNIYPIIVGDIRDLSKSCGYTSYTTRGRDKYLAINGATVTLVNVATGGSKTYTTDQFNNGFYTFYDCVEGATYEITVKKDGYKTVSKRVTVGADGKGTQHLLNFDMEEGVASGIEVSPASVDFGEVTAETSTSKTINVTGTDLTAAISVSSSNTTDFAISTTSLAKTGGSLTVTYKPAVAGSHSTTITLTSGSHKKTIVVSGSAKNPPLTFTEGWNFSETSGKKAAWMTDYVSFRNMTFGAGKLYVVNNTSEILILKAQTGEKLGSLNMTGVEGGTLNVIDVKYVDGKIAACNLATTAEGEQVLKVYVWDNDSATPRVLLETTNIGGTVRLGDTFNIKGDLSNGALYFAEGRVDTDTKVVSYTITNGVAATTPTVLTVTEDGSTGIKFGLSPRVIPESDGKFWCVGQNFYPTLFDSEGLVMASVNAEALKSECAGNTFKAFSFKGSSYGLATTYEPNSASAERLRKGRVVLLDGAAGWAEASNVGEYPSAGLGTTRNSSMSSGVEVAVNGTQGVEMWVLVHNQGIAYYKHGTAPTYTYENVPSISAGTSSLVFETTGYQKVSKEIVVSGSYLTADINLALSGANASQFELSTTKVAQSSGSASATVTVTYNPTTAETHKATLTLTSAGASTVNIALTGTNEEDYEITGFGLTQQWAQTSGHLTANTNTRWATAFGEKIYINDHANSKLYYWSKDGLTDMGIATAAGTAITSDDAGNIIISTSMWAAGSTAYKVLPSGSTTLQDLTISLPDTMTANQMQYMGKAIGNILSADGGAMYIYPKNTCPAKIIIKSGAQSSAVMLNDGDLVADAQSIAVPLTSDINSNSVAARVRGSRYFYVYNNSAFTVQEHANVNTTAGGTYFTLQDILFAVEPIGTAYCDGFQVVNTSTGEIVATHAAQFSTAKVAPNANCLVAEIVDEWNARIYQYVPGQLAAQYLFEIKHTTGVEDIAMSEDAEMTIVKNGSTLAVAGVEAQAIAIYSMNGALVRMINNANEVAVDGLNGMYIVAVADAQGVVRTEKVIIK